MEKILQIAVLGCGHIGKKHAEMISQNPACQLVAIIDSDSLLSNNTYRDVPFFDSLTALFKSGIPADIISICTPNGLHFSQAKESLLNGNNVIIEKPLTLNSSEAKILQQMAAELNLKVFPVMQNRFSPPAVWLKDLMTSEVLGQIYMVQISCFWNRDSRYYQNNSWRGTKELDGGTLFTQFSHYLDIMNWLFGDITNISAKLADFNHAETTEFEDSGIVTFDFKSGGMGSFNFSTSVWEENLESSLTIIAQNGSVKVGGQYMDKVEKCHIKDYEMPQLDQTSASIDYGCYKGSAQNHHFLYQDVVEVFRNNSKPKTNSEESIALIEIIEKIYKK